MRAEELRRPRVACQVAASRTKAVVTHFLEGPAQAKGAAVAAAPRAEADAARVTPDALRGLVAVHARRAEVNAGGLGRSRRGGDGGLCIAHPPEPSGVQIRVRRHTPGVDARCERVE